MSFIIQVLCGNKCDLDTSRVVSQSEGASYAERMGIPFFETSAKDGINVAEAIAELVRRTPRLKGKEYKLVILGENTITLCFIQTESGGLVSHTTWATYLQGLEPELEIRKFSVQ